MAGTLSVGPFDALDLMRKVCTASIAALGVFCIAAFTCSWAQASESEVADLVNRLRSPQSMCPVASGLKQLVRRPELDKAAAAILGGVSFEDSVRAAGYRADSVKAFNFSGSTDRAALEKLLAGSYCPSITDAKLADIGVHQRGTTTWVLLAAAFAPGGGLDEGAMATRLLTLVNQARAESRRCGDTVFLPARPLLWNELLTRVARAHSEEMARHNYFDHDSLDGSTPSQRLKRAGYVYRDRGENIAAGITTPEEVIAGWIESQKHCANLMEPAFTEMGVALATNVNSKYGAYWTQVFGTPRAVRNASAVSPSRL